MHLAFIPSINLFNLGFAALFLTVGWLGANLMIARNRERRRRREECQWPRRPGKILTKRVSLKANGCRYWLEQTWEFDARGQILSPEAPMSHRLARFFVDIEDGQTQNVCTIQVSRAEFDLLVPGSFTEYAAGRYSDLDEHAPELLILAPEPA